jgi:hypothetical protein
MTFVGVELLRALEDGQAFDGKMVFNANGAVLGSVSTQHRELRAEGIAYADEYKGNAMAAMLARRTIEIRFHRDFTDAQVSDILRALASQPGLEFLASWRATYQGRVLAR